MATGGTRAELDSLIVEVSSPGQERAYLLPSVLFFINYVQYLESCGLEKTVSVFRSESESREHGGSTSSSDLQV